MYNKIFLICWFTTSFVISIYNVYSFHQTDLNNDNHHKQRFDSSNYTMIKKRENILTKYIDFNLTILDQISSNKLPNIPCQNITDLPNSPVLMASDDFIIPPLSTFIINNIPSGIDNCRALIFSISYMRNYRDASPENIILYIMKDSIGIPGNIVFKKTFKQPDNGWNLNVYNPGSLILKINVGDKDDNGKEFDISSSSLFARTKLWVSFFVTLKRHFSLTGFSENMVFWITYNKDQNKQLTELDSPYKYYNTTSNYYYIDINNLFNKNLTKWTNAIDVEKKMTFQSNTLNLAWKVDLLCTQTIIFIEINKTTDAPTIVPTTTPIPTNESIYTKPPYQEDGSSVLPILLFFFITLLIVLCLTCTCYLHRFIYKPVQIVNIDDYLTVHKNEETIYSKYETDDGQEILFPNAPSTEGVFITSKQIEAEIELNQ